MRQALGMRMLFSYNIVVSRACAATHQSICIALQLSFICYKLQSLSFQCMSSLKIFQTDQVNVEKLNKNIFDQVAYHLLSKFSSAHRLYVEIAVR